MKNNLIKKYIKAILYEDHNHWEVNVPMTSDDILSSTEPVIWTTQMAKKVLKQHSMDFTTFEPDGPEEIDWSKPYQDARVILRALGY